MKNSLFSLLSNNNLWSNFKLGATYHTKCHKHVIALCMFFNINVFLNFFSLLLSWIFKSLLLPNSIRNFAAFKTKAGVLEKYTDTDFDVMTNY